MSGKSGIKGLIVGLAGIALLGWALFSAFTATDCLADAARRASVGAAQGCSSSGPGWLALAIPGGIILSVIGMFLGGGIFVFCGLFLAIGLSALVPTILGMMPNMELFGWLFGGIFTLSGLAPFLAGLLMRRSFAAKQQLAEELVVSGRKGIGTIVEVRDTGTTINDNPRVIIRMRIAPLDNGPPVERSKTATVSRVQIPRVGERYPVWFDNSDPEKWMFATAMDETAPAEVKDMFARARAEGPPASLHSPPGDDGEAGPVAELATLTELWKDGALTDAEFAEAKARLLPRIGR